MKFNYFVSLGRPGTLMPQRFLQSMQFFALTILLAFGYTNANAQVIISEVFADGVFELRNTGNGTVDISSYWICDFPDYRRLNQLEIQCGSLNLAAGEEVVLRAEGLHEPNDSELGLYATNSFGSSDAIVSYLEWGSSGHQRAALATGKGIWDGNAIAAFTDTQSLQIGGDGLAAADWTINASPNACGDDAPPPPPGATSSARYRVTFDAAWSSATHPTDFPSNAHFSGLIGLTHTANVALFELGGTASPGLINMAETGGKSPLNDEIQGVINSGQGQTLISGGGIATSPGTVSVEFDIDDAHPLVTLTSMIAPSPDWFVGVRDLDLFENGTWANSKVVEVANYDAGSDSGASFASGNQSTNPQGTITMITDGPLVINGAIPSMGTLTFTRIDAGACDAAGGTLTGGPFTYCVDGEADNIPAGAITLSGNEGANNQWVVTDEAGTILGLPGSFTGPDFDAAGAGVCFVWNLAYEDGLMGLAAGNNVSQLEGCYSLSNSVRVTRNQPNGGTLVGGPFTFCVDGTVDNIPANGISLVGNTGGNSQWVVTDEAGMILGLPGSFTGPNFDAAGVGVCFVWHLSYEDGLAGLAAGNNVSQLAGCYNLSNSVQVTRQECGDMCNANGGTLTGGPFTFNSIGDGVADNLAAGSITLANNSGQNSQWVVTDDQGNILGLPPMPSAVNFDGAGSGNCFVWHLSYEDGLTGLGAGMNTANLEGCYSLSNSVEVIRNNTSGCNTNGGELFGGPFTFNSIGDGVADNIAAGSITLANNSGTNSQWVVTDEQGNILGLPPMPSAVNFDGAGSGKCFIWHLSYEDGLTGLGAGMNTANLEGCYSLSNSVEVIRNNADGCNTNGGELFGGPFTFNSIGDGVADNITAGSITLANNSGTNSQWVVTDDQGNILGLPPMPSAVNFDGAGSGTCLIWHLSFEDGLQGAEIGKNASDLVGCYSLSNSIQVIRNNADGCNTNGGELFGGPFTFNSIGDGVADNIPAGSITVANNSGQNSQWVVTDEQGNILGLPPMPSAVNFDGAGSGTCLIWYLSFEDGLQGAEVGKNASDLVGCYSLSNSIQVIRNNADGCNTNGGELFGGPFTFNSIGDGVADNIPAGSITVANNSGQNSQWVVTDEQGNILGLPPMPSAVNFDGAGAGTCLIWYLSFEDGLQGAEVGLNANDLVGCHSLSNPIEVIRNNATGCNVNGGELFGGPFTFNSVGDGVADNLAAGSITVANNSGTNSQWVVTDDQGNILGLPPMPSAVDFDGAGAGTCFIWYLAYEDGLTGLAGGNNVSQLEGCYSLSNSVEVIRNEATSDCGTPTNLVIENIDSRRTRISWDKVDGASRYKIEIRFAGQTRIVGRGLIRSNRVFVFAPAGRDYEIRLQTQCQDGGTSAYTDWVAYSTPSSLVNTGIAQSRNADDREGLEAIEVLNEAITDIAVYPNPVSDVLSIDYQTSSNTGVLTVFHVSGKQVLVNQLAEDAAYHSVNLNHLSDGAYILTIQEAGKLPYTQRIIKGAR